MTDETRNLLGSLIRDATKAISDLREEFGEVKGEVSRLRTDISRIEGKVDGKSSIPPPSKSAIPWSLIFKIAFPLAVIAAAMVTAYLQASSPGDISVPATLQDSRVLKTPSDTQGHRSRPLFPFVDTSTLK